MQYPKGEEETRRKNETKKGVVDFGLSRFWVVKGVLLRSRARLRVLYIQNAISILGACRRGAMATLSESNLRTTTRVSPTVSFFSRRGAFGCRFCRRFRRRLLSFYLKVPLL